MKNFRDLSVSDALVGILEKKGYTTPTDIQAQAIPLLLADEPIDFHGQAQTGTGKTLAFGIPLCERIDPTRKQAQAMIVAPTRELAVQIYESLKPIAKAMGISTAVIYGGVSIDEQIRALRAGAQIIVGTPGRIKDHLSRKTLNPASLRVLVLDEADIMLEMGFKEEIEDIMRVLPDTRRIWLFSATVKKGIADLMKRHMRDTVSVRVSAAEVATANTKQYYCIVPYRARIHAITRFIQQVGDFYGFIFCQTKVLASDVADELSKRGYNVAALHGDLSQLQRNRVIKKFRKREKTILVATDVAARGIDIPQITHVINYTIPEDLESYVHRVGRTGRAGHEGIAITFISKTEQRIIKQIERQFHTVIEPIDVPSPEQVIRTRLAEIPAYIDGALEGVVEHTKEIAHLVSELSPDELMKVATKALHQIFIEPLDLEEIPYTHVEDEEQYQEIYLNVGSDDGVTASDVKRYLLQVPDITPEQIKKIRVIKKRSYIKLSSDCSPDLIAALRGKRMNGRQIRVQVTCMVSAQRKSSRKSSYKGRRSRRR